MSLFEKKENNFIILNCNQITSHLLTGNQVSISTNTVQDGGALFMPILDDFLRTYHTKPQAIDFY